MQPSNFCMNTSVSKCNERSEYSYIDIGHFFCVFIGKNLLMLNFDFSSLDF